MCHCTKHIALVVQTISSFYTVFYSLEGKYVFVELRRSTINGKHVLLNLVIAEIFVIFNKQLVFLVRDL